MNSYGWVHSPIRATLDGSTYWDTSMPVDSPGVSTGDHMISNWDLDLFNSDELAYAFSRNQIIEMGAVWRDGKIGKNIGVFSNPPEFKFSEKGKQVLELISDVAKEIYNFSHEDIFSVFYYPQFDVISIMLHPDKYTDVELNTKIANYLESIRETKLKEWKDK
jgi:hypothetical protein